MSHLQKAEEYRKAVLSGEIVACKWVRLACLRQEQDLAKQNDPDYPYYFDVTAAEKVCRFIEMMPHTKGKWAGARELLKLEPWQCFIVTTVFGWLRNSDRQRRFREMYIELPRKNGKSALAAAIGLYMFAADGEHGAEVYSGATSEKQAWEVFRPAKVMAKKAPGFKQRFGIDTNAANINILENESRFEPLIGKPGDGASPSCAIVDEYHEHKTDELYDTMVTGMGARTQPLMVVITTAGANLAGPCYLKRGQVLKVLEGTFESEDIFGIVYTIDEGDDWTDIANWRKANPNFGVSVFEDFLLARLREAQQQTNKQNKNKCKHLNIWNNAASAWMNMEFWNACEDKELRIEDFIADPCHEGLDLASQIDIAARVRLFSRMIDDKRHYYIFPLFYLPSEVVYEDGTNTHYEGWVAKGLINATEGNEIDFGQIEQDIKDDAEIYNLVELSFDAWQSVMIIQRLTDHGVNCIRFPMQLPTLSPAMKEVFAAAKSGRLHHDGNPVMTWMISNVVCREDTNENIKPLKETKEAKIDGAVALIMAVGRAMQFEGLSVYEERGFDVF